MVRSIRLIGPRGVRAGDGPRASGPGHSSTPRSTSRSTRAPASGFCATSASAAQRTSTSPTGSARCAPRSSRTGSTGASASSRRTPTSSIDADTASISIIEAGAGNARRPGSAATRPPHAPRRARGAVAGTCSRRRRRAGASRAARRRRASSTARGRCASATRRPCSRSRRWPALVTTKPLNGALRVGLDVEGLREELLPRARPLRAAAGRRAVRRRGQPRQASSRTRPAGGSMPTGSRSPSSRTCRRAPIWPGSSRPSRS